MATEIVEVLAEASVRSIHAQLIERTVKEMREASKNSYRDRDVSGGYWLAQRADILESNVGYIECLLHDLRGQPPAGHIWIRPATSGKWGKSRKDKKGRPLSCSEMQSLLKGGKL